MLVPRDFQEQLLKGFEDNKIVLEGNILKVIEYDGFDDFREYIEHCTTKDKEKRAKTLEVTKGYQKQNKELEDKARLLEEAKINLQVQVEENEALMVELKDALSKAENAKRDAEENLRLAENAKKEAEQDLDIMQKKQQFQLIGSIVSTARFIIVSVGLVTTLLYIIAILYQSDQITLLGNTWSNMFGILLTNSFSIIGTIMGVKYASEKNKEEV